MVSLGWFHKNFLKVFDWAVGRSTNIFDTETQTWSVCLLARRKLLVLEPIVMRKELHGALIFPQINHVDHTVAVDID